jgi:hypothetical protein
MGDNVQINFYLILSDQLIGVHSWISLGKLSPLLDTSTAFCSPAFGRRPSHTHHASGSAAITLAPIWFANSECHRLIVEMFYIRAPHAPQQAEPPRRHRSNQAQTLRTKASTITTQEAEKSSLPVAGRERATSVLIMEAVLDMLSPQGLTNVVYFTMFCNVEILRM